MRDAKSRLSARRKRARRRVLLIFIGSGLVILVLLLHVWISSRAVELAYEIDTLAAEKRSLEEENRRLSLEIAKLEDPERISRIAIEELNMVRSKDAEVVIISGK